jgi:hypothetical protein
MRVMVIGTGNMGRAIGHRIVAGGNSLTLVSRHLEGAQELAEELRGRAEGGAAVEVSGLGEGLHDEVVIPAVYYPVTLEVVRGLGEALDGRILVDISNPVNETFDGLATAPGTSAAEELAAVAPEGARVVKAFNTTFAGTLVEGKVAGQALDVFLAGDDEGAKETVAQLVRDGGLRAIDSGPLERARQLESLGFLHMMAQQPLGTGFASAVKIVP